MYGQKPYIKAHCNSIQRFSTVSKSELTFAAAFFGKCTIFYFYDFIDLLKNDFNCHEKQFEQKKD